MLRSVVPPGPGDAALAAADDRRTSGQTQDDRQRPPPATRRTRRQQRGQYRQRTRAQCRSVRPGAEEVGSPCRGHDQSAHDPASAPVAASVAPPDRARAAIDRAGAVPLRTLIGHPRGRVVLTPRWNVSPVGPLEVCPESSSSTTIRAFARLLACSSSMRGSMSCEAETAPAAWPPRRNRPTSCSWTSTCLISTASCRLAICLDDAAPKVVLTSSRDPREFGSLLGRSGANGFIPKGELSPARICALL